MKGFCDACPAFGGFYTKIRGDHNRSCIVPYYRHLLCKNTIAGWRMYIIMFFFPLTSYQVNTTRTNRRTNNTSPG